MSKIKLNSRPASDIIFISLFGIGLGILGGMLDKTAVGVVGAVVLAGFFGLYNGQLQRNSGLMSGLIAGSVLGVFVGGVGWLLDGQIVDVGSGALFGLLRGALIGAGVGVVTRATSEATDTLSTRAFLFAGSVFLGTVLGGVVGLTTGIILGLVGHGIDGAVRATIVGAILGASLGSYYKETRWVALGAFACAVLAAVSSLIGGGLAGVVIGGIGGSFAPMLLVSAIGAFGGLTSRGLKAMVVEALEAPTEMLEQGAVSFLAPAILIGVTVGGMSVRASSVIALTITFALVGLFFGLFGELNGGINPKVTIRSMIEMAMIGSDTWPIGKAIEQVRQNGRKKIVSHAALGIGLGLLSSIIGSYIGQFLITIM